MEIKNKIIIFLLLLSIITCSVKNQYNFTLQNTQSIKLNKIINEYYFNIPIQYIIDRQISNFKFINCYVLIGDYKIIFENDDLDIFIFVNINSDEFGNIDEASDQIYLERNGEIIISKMNETLSGNSYLKYDIFIERVLSHIDIENILLEYKKNNINSILYLEYEITIDNETIKSTIFDNFEISVK